MALYENVFIARQDISATQVEALTESFASVVKERGGEVKKREYWGLRNLTFRIKKNRKGHYMLLNIDAPPAAVIEMERTMRLNEDVLRYMSIKVEALEDGPSAMIQSRGHRDERGDRGDRFDRGDRGDRYGRRREGGDAPAPVVVDDRGGRAKSEGGIP